MAGGGPRIETERERERWSQELAAKEEKQNVSATPMNK